MYKYQNTKTGVVVLVESNKVGGDWVLIEEKQSPSIAKVEEKEEIKPVKKATKKKK